MSNWTDLTLLHGNEEGARAAFERACEMVIRAKHPLHTVRGIRVNQGDAGIDVYVGELGVSPIDVYQCKYFTDGIGDSQKKQIRNSYDTATNSAHFEVKNWYLCLPIDLSVQETSWFSGWSKKCETPVDLLSPSEMMFWAESTGLASSIFKRDDSLKLDWIVSDLKQHSRDPWMALVEQTETDCYKILLTLLRKYHQCISGSHPNLNGLYLRAEAGDRLDACEYVKAVLAGPLPNNHKVWIFNMLSDFTMEPIAFRFIRRYDALLAKAKDFNRMEELSTSEFYTVWGMLRSPLLQSFRDQACWKVKFQ
ncbi:MULTISPECIES: hypothetical protein [Xanthomonas]|uniref:hypothetical protein n=1 Tax=Xanthomonas TaxID=338 RepID=UPI000B1109AA|nr:MULTISPECIES: hypothetical protein [Xanthomonas]MBO9749432.1 hypothetical protein [Xanthomonas phaseoli pv. dieffenbachiae]MBO9745518.1 hypothetical protein [Xanthomonas phaseoli pv. phaseoli]MBO9751727.1 hypothetical protein [Xanthomonas phaseoli pv. dieffenbachiae]MBO9891663.1 hypothetical protein [Xanthomonas sp. D-36-1]QUF60021.1 hypothetical protein XppCFBP6164P_24575 [Xanthomonas phaseoli pv. phaseoli]